MPSSKTMPAQSVQRLTAVVRRVARPRARAAAAAAFIAGLAGDLAALWRQPEAHPGTGKFSDRQRTHRGRNNATGDHTHGQGGSYSHIDHDRQADQRHQLSAQAGNHHAGGGGHDHLHSHGSGDHHAGHAGGEAKPTPTPTPTPTPSGHVGGGHGGGGGGGGNGRGNAGSAFFNSPLATKTRRRAHDFAHHHANAGAQTNGISVSTGPDGATIQTHNITYHAAPTTVPTPFPAVTLPHQVAAPRLGAISGTPTPSMHNPADASGGNTSTGFMS